MFSLLLQQSSYMTCFQMMEFWPKLIILGTFYHYYKFVNIVEDSNLFCSLFSLCAPLMDKFTYLKLSFLSNYDSNGYRSRSRNTQPPDQAKRIKNNSNIQFQICLKIQLEKYFSALSSLQKWSFWTSYQDIDSSLTSNLIIFQNTTSMWKCRVTKTLL